MVVGVDVFHEKGHRSGSVASIVSTMNDNLSRYYSTVAIQKEGQEIVDALTVRIAKRSEQYQATYVYYLPTYVLTILLFLFPFQVAFIAALIKYYEVNHFWPKNIIMYRDGVADSQMDVAASHEMPQLTRAFKAVRLGVPSGASKKVWY